MNFPGTNRFRLNRNRRRIGRKIPTTTTAVAGATRTAAVRRRLPTGRSTAAARPAMARAQPLKTLSHHSLSAESFLAM